MTISIKLLKFVLILGLISFLLTVFTVFKAGYLEREKVDPNFSIYATGYVNARGWPFPFLGDNPLKENFGKIGLEDKFLGDIFLFDWALMLILILLILIPLYLIKGILVQEDQP
jgi:hypothetical protein